MYRYVHYDIVSIKEITEKKKSNIKYKRIKRLSNLRPSDTIEYYTTVVNDAKSLISLLLWPMLCLLKPSLSAQSLLPIWSSLSGYFSVNLSSVSYAWAILYISDCYNHPT